MKFIKKDQKERKLEEKKSQVLSVLLITPLKATKLYDPPAII